MKSLWTFTRELIFPPVKMVNTSRQTTHCELGSFFFFSFFLIILRSIFVELGQRGCPQMSGSEKMSVGQVSVAHQSDFFPLLAPTSKYLYKPEVSRVKVRIDRLTSQQTSQLNLGQVCSSLFF